MITIAANEAEHVASLFKVGGTTGGFIRKVTKTRIDLVIGSEELTINAHGVLCARTKAADGKTWYSYASESFLPSCLQGYRTRCEWCANMLEKHGITQKHD